MVNSTDSKRDEERRAARIYPAGENKQRVGFSSMKLPRSMKNEEDDTLVSRAKTIHRTRTKQSEKDALMREEHSPGCEYVHRYLFRKQTNAKHRYTNT